MGNMCASARDEDKLKMQRDLDDARNKNKKLQETMNSMFGMYNVSANDFKIISSSKKLCDMKPEKADEVKFAIMLTDAKDPTSVVFDELWQGVAGSSDKKDISREQFEHFTTLIFGKYRTAVRLQALESVKAKIEEAKKQEGDASSSKSDAAMSVEDLEDQLETNRMSYTEELEGSDDERRKKVELTVGENFDSKANASTPATMTKREFAGLISKWSQRNQPINFLTSDSE
eukprot:g1340.t1